MIMKVKNINLSSMMQILSSEDPEIVCCFKLCNTMHKKEFGFLFLN